MAWRMIALTIYYTKKKHYPSEHTLIHILSKAGLLATDDLPQAIDKINTVICA